jgi:uncharacterized protein (TIGR03435 family)
MNRLVAGLVVSIAFAASAAAVRAQAPAATSGPSFEVASVKPSNPNPTGPLGSIPMMLPPVGGRVSATNMPLRLLIRAAYEVQDFQVVGGPSWQLSNKFDIVAKAEDGFTGSTKDVLPMMKALLADRFKLKVHTETREMPISALVIARNDKKLGPDIMPSTVDCSGAEAEAQKRMEAFARGGAAAVGPLLPRPGQTIPCSIMPAAAAGGGFGLRASGQPMSVLINLLTQATGRIVQDRTGLTGRYDWQLKFDPEVLMRLVSQLGINVPQAAVNAASSDNPSLLTALDEQLGLKLASERGPVQVLVIDSAELPSPD